MDLRHADVIPGLAKGAIVCAEEAYKQSVKNENPDSIFGTLFL